MGSEVKLEMVYIPGGSFRMGSPDKEAGRYYVGGPQHKVTLMPFLMGIYPVTQEQYQAIKGENPAHFTGQNRPVEQVSWDDAKSFCQKLSDKTGRKFSLPSESQWEYACRAGTTTPFNFGKTMTSEFANYYSYSGYNYGNGPKGEYREETTPVGKFPPNKFGLYDMHGNVWEWCADDYHENYVGAPTDGSVWLNGDTDTRLLRGGSWCSLPRRCRSADRNYYCSDDSSSITFGFRIVSAPQGS